MPCTCPHADLVAIAAVFGAPYIAVHRHRDEGNGESNGTASKADDKQGKVGDEGVQVAEQSVSEILRGDSRELAKLRDAVR